jgi:hypothetical protein
MTRGHPVLVLCLALLFAASAPVAWAGESKKKEDAPQGEFIELPTLTATVIRPDGGRGVMTVQAVLYIPDPALRLRGSKSIPLLLNAYVPALQSLAYRLPPGVPPNIDALTVGLQQATDGVLKPGARVLLGGVMVN